VMASGLGDKSRLYKTKDGCSHWALLYANKDKAGFWDAFVFWARGNGLLLGDPTETTYDRPGDSLNWLHLEFTVFFTGDGGATWTRQVYSRRSPLEVVDANESAAFAASNSALAIVGHNAWIGTGGKKGANVLVGDLYSTSDKPELCDCDPMPPTTMWFTHSVPAPLAAGAESTGVFSLHFRDAQHGMAVGGDYTKPNASAGTAAWSSDGGNHWTAPTTPPHGYRSAVQWSEELRAWVAVGTNGSDVSRDDGRTWLPLDNGNWNALSLPFIVGPKGRIAHLNASALPHP